MVSHRRDVKRMPLRETKAAEETFTDSAIPSENPDGDDAGQGNSTADFDTRADHSKDVIPHSSIHHRLAADTRREERVRDVRLFRKILQVAFFVAGCVFFLPSSVAAQSPEASVFERGDWRPPVLGARETTIGSGRYQARYRQNRGDYRLLRTEKFDLIYPAGHDSTATLFYDALMAEYASVDSLVGHSHGPLRTPIIVNPFTDLTNGFVHPAPLRSEMYTAHSTSAFGAGFESWPEAVAPHELVHALHADLSSGVGVGGLVRIFSPDLSRTLNLSAPRGWTEGIAVMKESRIRPRAGRLNAPLALMHYRAALASDDPWGLAEVMNFGPYERAGSRPYLGGGQFVEYLLEQDADAFQTATRRYHRWPFLGFGAALWGATGTFPPALSDQFVAAERERETARQSALADVSTPEVLASEPGFYHRRPVWTGDSTLVFYGSGYATRAGFFRMNVRTGRRERIATTATNRGRTASLSPDSTHLYFARKVPGPIVSRRYFDRIFRLDLSTGEASPVSTANGLFAPARLRNGETWAARRDGAFSRLAVVRDGTVKTSGGRRGLRLKGIAPSPAGTEVAVLANDGGRQGIYRATPDDPSLQPWVRFQDGQIYDLSWGPQGRYLLFSADPTGVANAYMLDTETGDVRRLTTVRYGALEPSLSPDRSQIAFVRYRHERFDLVRMAFRPGEASLAEDVERDWTPSRMQRTAAASERNRSDRSGTGDRPDNSARSGPTGPSAQGAHPGRTAASTSTDRSLSADPSLPGASALDRPSRPYRAWRHLQPRTVQPTLRFPEGFLDGETAAGDNLGTGVGVRLSGADPLQTWAYDAEAFVRNQGLWGNLRLETGLVPGTPSLSAFRRPFQALSRGRRVIIEERGLGLGIRQQITLHQNVTTTAVGVSAEAEFRQTRPIDESSDPLRNRYIDRLTLRPTLRTLIRAQQNLRDLVPRTGLITTTVAEVDLRAPGGISGSRAFNQRADLYLPVLSAVNGGVRTTASYLTQNRGSIFNTERFAPRGYRDLGPALPDAGTYLRFDLRITQPLWYVDRGSVLLPVFVDALYGFGMGQAQYRVDADGTPALVERRAAATGGLGVQVNGFRVEVGLSYRIDLDGLDETVDRWAWTLTLR